MGGNQAAVALVVGLLLLPAAAARGAAHEVHRERHDCCETYYDHVRGPDGSRLRTIVTRPAGRPGRLPAVLFVGWLSCDSVELRPQAQDGWSRFLRALVAESGAVVMRMDKPGVGDSEGVCAETDLDSEVAAYRAALQALKRLEFVDEHALALVGASLGGAIAPLVAAGQPLKAVAVWGTFSRTWLEHLLELERRRLALAGDPPGLVNEKLRGLAELHARILTDRALPRDVLAAHPRLGPLWYGEPTGLYGRPAAFYHQAQAANVAAAWEKVDAPVLAVHGEYDWIMSRSDHELIADVVSRARAGGGRFLSIPRTDHHLLEYASPEQAFREQGGRYTGTAAEAIVGFVRRHLVSGLASLAEVEGLAASARPPGEPPNRGIFDPLIGSWEVDVTYHRPDGARTQASGSWNFGWVLEGRAVQDVWRVSAPGRDPLGYGTTIRFYDPAIDAWRVTWHGVLTGSVQRFIARRQGAEIVMEAEGGEQPSRWIFSDIEPAGFRWRAVSSADGGRSWVTEQEMVARRRPPLG
jgi:pimeloyl-ACP methyl ester carboxylesterase